MTDWVLSPALGLHIVQLLSKDLSSVHSSFWKKVVTQQHFFCVSQGHSAVKWVCSFQLAEVKKRIHFYTGQNFWLQVSI